MKRFSCIILNQRPRPPPPPRLPPPLKPPPLLRDEPLLPLLKPPPPNELPLLREGELKVERLRLGLELPWLPNERLLP